jgi:hypothetical protein
VLVLDILNEIYDIGRRRDSVSCVDIATRRICIKRGFVGL